MTHMPVCNFMIMHTTRTHSPHGVRIVLTVLYRCASSSQNDLRIRIGFVTAFASVKAGRMLNPHSHILRKTLYRSQSNAKLFEVVFALRSYQKLSCRTCLRHAKTLPRPSRRADAFQDAISIHAAPRCATWLYSRRTFSPKLCQLWPHTSIMTRHVSALALSGEVSEQVTKVLTSSLPVPLLQSNHDFQ